MVDVLFPKIQTLIKKKMLSYFNQILDVNHNKHQHDKSIVRNR